MTLLKKSIMMLLLVTWPVASVFSMKRPIHAVDAREAYKDDAEKLDAAIDYIITYYEVVGEDGLTGFEQEVDDICRVEIDYFWSQEVTEKSAVIIDIDETTLSNYWFSKECNFTTQRGGGAMQFRKDMKCIAIEPVRAFCAKSLNILVTSLFISAQEERH